ncbi:MAG: YggS family pyridoxal phosphate-dependent enzyme [Beutenbergiaceae bacterium]
MTSVPQALARVQTRIDQAAITVGRDPATIRMLLAVKTVPSPTVREAIAAGGTLLGHNRAQELLSMEPDLADVEHQTHFIGHLQSNKAGQVSRWVSCVQTVDSFSLAQRLSRVRPQYSDHPLDIMVQVNTSGEPTKSGVAPRQAADLIASVAQLPALRLRGLMTIGANSTDIGRVRASYDALAQLREQTHAAAIPGAENATELSMGMSGDLEIAVEAGATMVRIGSAVFGDRPSNR